MKTYEDLEGDGGSNIIGQVVQLGEKQRSRLDKIKHKVALMSGTMKKGNLLFQMKLLLTLFWIFVKTVTKPS